MSNYKPDAGIPMLTEIIPALDAALPPAIVSTRAIEPMPRIDMVTAPTPESAAPALPAALPVTMPEADLRRLEQDVAERVLQQILQRIDFVLEQRVRDSLADVLQTSVQRLADDLRQGLRHSLTDVVTRAVTQEISRLQSSKKQ